MLKMVGLPCASTEFTLEIGRFRRGERRSFDKNGKWGASEDWQLTRPPLLIFVLRHSRLHQFLHQRIRKWFVQRELNGPLRSYVALEFGFECLNNRGGR